MEEKGISQLIVPPGWASLASLSQTISQLSEQRCVKDLNNILAHISGLETRVSQHESNDRSHKAEALKAADEVRRLKEEQRARQEEIIESNARLLRKKDEEKTALNQALTRQEDELRDKGEQMQKLKEVNRGHEEQIDEQDVQTKKIEARLRETRVELERVQKLVKQHEALLKSKDQDLQAEKKAHDRSKADIEVIRGQITELQTALNSSQDTVRQIERLAPALVDTPSVDV